MAARSRASKSSSLSTIFLTRRHETAASSRRVMAGFLKRYCSAVSVTTLRLPATQFWTRPMASRLQPAHLVMDYLLVWAVLWLPRYGAYPAASMLLLVTANSPRVHFGNRC